MKWRIHTGALIHLLVYCWFSVFVSISLFAFCRTVILLYMLCNLEGLLNITMLFEYYCLYPALYQSCCDYCRIQLMASALTSISEIYFQSENAIHSTWRAVSLVECCWSLLFKFLFQEILSSADHKEYNSNVQDTRNDRLVFKFSNWWKTGHLGKKSFSC